MALKKTDIFVFAHWKGMPEAKQIGTLSAQAAKGKKAFSFTYDPEFLQSKEQFLLDPDIGWYEGVQYAKANENFGIFLDSMPDTWGKTLMKRRAVNEVQVGNRLSSKLYDIDFLLGVFDESRMGALRFKLVKDGPFLDDNRGFPIPPWSSIRDLQYGARIIESDVDNDETKKWLAILMAPGSSLGGARPKANILDENNHPWIAKFPSKNDEINKAKWEFLAYRLAIASGIEMTESNIEKIAGKHDTFFTKRFDRLNGERIHFASAMTMTGNTEETIKNDPPSYLDLAEFIQFSGAEIEKDLHQLWRRIVFSIAISNTDDHLRNHGFVLTEKGWRLSPAYDINPSIDKSGLALNIDSVNNALDFDLAKSVGEYFQLNETQMNTIINEVLDVLKKWKSLAKEIGISRAEQQLMEAAFWV